MATLTTKNFSALVQEWAAVVQSSVATANPNLLLSFTKGSILRAMSEAQASVSLWLQGLILKLLTVTRLVTSVGRDADTFVNDFGLTRLPAAAASGLVTFARNNPVNPATVPVGALMQTADGTQTFAVYADTSNSAFSVSGNGYVIPAQVISLQVPVRAVTAGAAGNVQAASITILQTGISGVDTVTNVAGFINGNDAESDTALRARFLLYIASLARATDGALGFAMVSVQQGIQYQILENQDPGGATDFGQVTIYVDDGSGAIPNATLAAVASAVQLYRAAGVRVGVFAATVFTANVTMTTTTALGYDHNTVVAQVIAAIGLYINGLGLGNTLSYLRLAQVAFDASPGVTDVMSYTLNNSVNDLVPAIGKTIKSGNIVVS